MIDESSDSKKHFAPAKVQPEAKQVAAAKAEPPAPTRTPQDWAERLGHIKNADARIPQQKTHADWQHAAADTAHGWSLHAYHYQDEPLLLTQDDYEKALVAAADYPAKPLHEPALSPLKKPKEKV